MKRHYTALMLATAVSITACATPVATPPTCESENSSNIKTNVVKLITSIETGYKTTMGYINSDQYIQHNAMFSDGLTGFNEMINNAHKDGYKARVVRAFRDCNYVFTHSQYEMEGAKVGFDVFRFESGKLIEHGNLVEWANGNIVEHWDNLATITPPNPSGRTQLDGATDITDWDKTEANKEIVADFADKVLINRKMHTTPTFINPNKYIQHNSHIGDGLERFEAAIKAMQAQGIVMAYDKVHKILGEGNFVLLISEGRFGANGGQPTAFYDLFRLEKGKIVEHWDVIEPILPADQWKNSNGKFGFQ